MYKKILVTGASGQLGKTIEEFYSNNEINLDFVFVSKSKLNITNKDHLKSFFNENRFDYCINCAAYTNVEQAEKKPEVAYKINSEGVKLLAETCKLGNTILIHISTDYVFDGEKEAFSTTDITNPINEYGKSKLLGEKHIQEKLKRYFIIRTSWLYSRKHGKNFYKSILKKAQTEKELFVTDEQTGCPTDTINLARYIIELIKTESSNFGIYHFCDDKVLTWYSFAEQILRENRLLSKTKLNKTKKYITFAKRPKYSVLKKLDK